MMWQRFLFLVFSIVLLIDLRAQVPVPVITASAQLVVFENGVFRQVDARRPQAMYQCGGRLAWISESGDLKLYSNGTVSSLQRGEPVDVAVSRHQLAWKTGPALRVPDGGDAKTVCHSVGRFTVSDSIITYLDQMDQVLKAEWNGRTVPIADILMNDGDVQWKSGRNTVLYYDRDRQRVMLLYRGEVSVLCGGSDPGRSDPGGDMVAYMGQYDDSFHVFDKGLVYDVESFAPASFQAGDGVVAFVSSTGKFRAFRNGRLWDIGDFTPDEYWVLDSVVVFREGEMFKVFSNGAVETLERTMPALWAVSGNMVAWLDLSGVLRAFEGGQRKVVSKEPGIAKFDVYPGTITFTSNSGKSKVWWKGKLFEHY